MRLSKKYEIKQIIREEMLIQLATYIKFYVYDYLRDNNLYRGISVDLDVNYVSCEVNVTFNDYTYEVSHYHFEDCLWAVHNIKKVEKEVKKELDKIFKK